MAKTKKYSKISYQLRLKLIELVCEDGIPCVLAGKELGISASTAKMIVKKYRENGEVF
jgi:transposase